MTGFFDPAFFSSFFDIGDEAPQQLGGALYRPRKTKKQQEEEEALIMAFWMLNETEYY